MKERKKGRENERNKRERKEIRNYNMMDTWNSADFRVIATTIIQVLHNKLEHVLSE